MPQPRREGRKEGAAASWPRPPRLWPRDEEVPPREGQAEVGKGKAEAVKGRGVGGMQWRGCHGGQKTGKEGSCPCWNKRGGLV